MDLWVLDEHFETVDVLDAYDAIVWTTRYNDVGEFELTSKYNEKFVNALSMDRYVMNKISDRYMIVETVQIDHDPTEGATITAKGRSLESILDRRIIWNKTTLKGNLQNGIKKLLYENIIEPADTRRTILDFRFKDSTDPEVTKCLVGEDPDAEVNYRGENLLDVIKELCSSNNLGFRVLPAGAGGFIFELYAGVDRSYRQNANLWVVFSPKFENISASNYLESVKEKKTVVLAVATQKVTETVTNSDGTKEQVEKEYERQAEVFNYNDAGPTRREAFSSVSVESENDQGVEYSETEFTKQLREKGAEYLKDFKTIIDFEGEADGSVQYLYGRDYQIGDIVQVVNEYGFENVARISEVVFSEDQNGSLFTPTFTAIE